MAATTTTSIKLDDVLKGRLQQLAASQRRSVHWLMREAIAEYVQREEQRALSGWNDIPVMAAAAKTEEAYAWLARLEAKGVASKLPKWR